MDNNSEQIEKAAEILNQGGIVIFPTDTAFGIGCRIDKPKTIERLFELRKRPENKATPVVVSGISMARRYLKPLTPQVESLMSSHWPGALTIVYPCVTLKVPEPVRGGGENLGVRMPDHSTILKIVDKVTVPVLAPSANFSGEKTPYTYEDIDKTLIKLVDYVVQGSTHRKSASTVIDCTSDSWKILRQGDVKIEL